MKLKIKGSRLSGIQFVVWGLLLVSFRDVLHSVLVIGGMTYCCIRLVFWAFERLNASDQFFELSEQGIFCPKKIMPRSRQMIAWRSVESLGNRLQKRPFQKPRELLVIRTRWQSIAIDVESLEGVIDAESLLRQIQSFLRSNFDVEQLARLSSERDRARAFNQRTTHLTNALIILIFGLFFVSLYINFTSPELGALGLFRLGAMIGGSDYEWYRLVMTVILHANLIHILFNAMALDFLGKSIERAVGAEVMFIFLMGSALIAGAVSSVLHPGVVLVGISGGLFGLLGAYLVMHLPNQRPMPPSACIPLKSWVLLLVVNSILPILVAEIDWIAHLGGFLLGIFLAWFLLLRRGRQSFPRGVRSATVFLAVFFVASLCAGLNRAVVCDSECTMDAALEIDKLSPAIVNQIVWRKVIDPASSIRDLQRFRSQAERALMNDPENFHLRDTVGALRFRLGDEKGAQTAALNVFNQVARLWVEEGVHTEFWRGYVTQVYRYFKGDRERVANQKPLLCQELLTSGRVIPGHQYLLAAEKGNGVVMWVYLNRDEEASCPSEIGTRWRLFSDAPYSGTKSGIELIRLDREVLSYPGPS